MFFKMAAARLTAGALVLSTMIAPALAVPGTVNTGSGRLNMRQQASTSSSVVTKIADGSSVEVLDTTTEGWYQISFSGMTGYVASQYIALEQAIQTAAQAAPSQDIPSQDIPAVAAMAPAETAPAEAAPAAEVPAETAAQAKVYGRVTTGKLNVRSGAGTDFDKCGSLGAGKVIEILESVEGWYRYEGGYVSAEYIRIVDESELAASGVASQVVEKALSYVGYPYVYGGSSPKGFDCSGFTSYVYKQFGYSLNRSASSQLDNGTPVSMSELQPGDLVLFRKSGSSKRASHVGLYIGDGEFVHASTAKVGVIVSKMTDAYYTTGFVGGRRII